MKSSRAVDGDELLVREGLGGAALDEGEDDGRVDVRGQGEHLVIHATTGPIGKYRTARPAVYVRTPCYCRGSNLSLKATRTA